MTDDLLLIARERRVETASCGAVVDPFGSVALDLPVEGELDLHTFRPAEVKDLLRDYLGACAEKGIFSQKDA